MTECYYALTAIKHDFLMYMYLVKHAYVYNVAFVHWRLHLFKMVKLMNIVYIDI